MAASNQALVVPPPSSSASVLTNDIRPIKPPVEIPSEWAWLWWTLAAVALAVAAAAAWLRWRRKRLQPAPVVLVPPHVRARQRLAEALALLHDPRVFCFVVSEALRVYLEERFRLHAPERTTEEFLVELQASSSLYPDQKQSLAEFLQNCDLVKFARHEPTEQALRDLHESALRLVDETAYEKVESPAPAAPGAVAQPASRVAP
jgi:hypothetical protein